jgi:hypothetical protein
MPNIYRNINLGVIVLIGIVFCYSYFFYPNNHPLDCVIKKHTGKNCSSCGISRAFSNFTHLNFSEGKQYNKHAFIIFIYFLLQFVFRVILALSKKTYLKLYFYTDVIFTILGFLISFTPMLVEQFIMFD